MYSKKYMYNTKQMQVYVYLTYVCISSVQFSRSVVFDTLRPHESQHAISTNTHKIA